MGQCAVIELLVTCVCVGMVQLGKSVSSVTFPTARDATLPLIQFNVHSVNLVIPLVILDSVVCTYTLYCHGTNYKHVVYIHIHE